jgi:hypothetical protein
MLTLSKHSIYKKSISQHVLPNAYTILKNSNFKMVIFQNAIFKIVFIEITLQTSNSS